MYSFHLELKIIQRNFTQKNMKLILQLAILLTVVEWQNFKSVKNMSEKYYLSPVHKTGPWQYKQGAQNWLNSIHLPSTTIFMGRNINVCPLFDLLKASDLWKMISETKTRRKTVMEGWNSRENSWNPKRQKLGPTQIFTDFSNIGGFHHQMIWCFAL